MRRPESHGTEVSLCRSSSFTRAPEQSIGDGFVQGLQVHLNRTVRVNGAYLERVTRESVGALQYGAPSLCPPVAAEPAPKSR